jgi:hypothetical protein
MALDVNKEVAKVKLSIKKAVPVTDNIAMQVKLLADVSGSFQDEFASGLVNPFFEAALSIAAAVDPDKKVQVVAFSSEAHDTGDYGVESADTIVNDFLKRTPRNILWYGTDYGRAVKTLNESANPKKSSGFFSSLFGKNTKQDDKPWLALFLSDGEDGGNSNEFIRGLQQLSERGVFTVLIGANSSPQVHFSLLREAADKIDGVTFHRVSDLKGCSTDSLYEKIFDDEFKNWYARYMATKAVA